MDRLQIINAVTQILTVVIAAGGLIIAIISLKRSAVSHSKSNRTQQKQEELTELQLKFQKDILENFEKSVNKQNLINKRKTADVRISLEGDNRNARFVIRNWGLTAAYDVNMEVQPLEGKVSPLMASDVKEKLPIKKLSAGSDFKLIAAISFDTGTTFFVKWSWRDDDKIHEESSQLSL